MNSQLNTKQADCVMTSPRIGLSPEIFASVFPFHLALDREQKIIQVSHVLPRICPGLAVGSQFEDYFRIKRPNIGIEPNAI